MSADQRVELARQYLTAARGRDVNYLRPSALLEEVVELRRHLGQVLAAAADLEDLRDAARQLAEIRAVLAAFDWEF